MELEYANALSDGFGATRTMPQSHDRVLSSSALADPFIGTIGNKLLVNNFELSYWGDFLSITIYHRHPIRSL